MTKLTKEQIEQERVEFEEWLGDFYQEKIDANEWDEKRNCYTEYCLHLAFKSWLACAELYQSEMRNVNFQIGRVSRHINSIKNNDDMNNFTKEKLTNLIKILDGIFN